LGIVSQKKFFFKGKFVRLQKSPKYRKKISKDKINPI